MEEGRNSQEYLLRGYNKIGYNCLFNIDYFVNIVYND